MKDIFQLQFALSILHPKQERFKPSNKASDREDLHFCRLKQAAQQKG
jgi:hypothetical protein